MAAIAMKPCAMAQRRVASPRLPLRPSASLSRRPGACLRSCRPEGLPRAPPRVPGSERASTRGIHATSPSCTARDITAPPSLILRTRRDGPAARAGASPSPQQPHRKKGMRSSRAPLQRRMVGTHAADASAPQRPLGAPRLIQHKQEAFWFYRFLSIVYDHVVNPGHWTEDMRADALSVAKLDSPDLKVRHTATESVSQGESVRSREREEGHQEKEDPVVQGWFSRQAETSSVCMQVYDVGAGTGFTTLGVAEFVKPENITMIDQSPHQLAKAKGKKALDKVVKLEVRLSCLAFEHPDGDCGEREWSGLPSKPTRCDEVMPVLSLSLSHPHTLLVAPSLP